MSHSVACSDCVRRLKSCSPWEPFPKERGAMIFRSCAASFNAKEKNRQTAKQDSSFSQDWEHETLRPFPAVSVGEWDLAAT